MTDLSNSKSDRIKLAGTYTTDYICSKIQNSKKDIYPYKRQFCFYSETEIPDNEADILIHMLVCMSDEHMSLSSKGTGDILPSERYYFIAVFLMPYYLRHLDESSLISKIVHSPEVADSLDELRNALKKKNVFDRQIKIPLRKVAKNVMITDFARSVKIFNVQDHMKEKLAVKQSVNCDFMDISNVWDRISYPHTLDVIFGQDLSKQNALENRTGSSGEEYEKKLFTQRENLSFMQGKKLKYRYPVYNVINMVISYFASLLALRIIIDIKAICVGLAVMITFLATLTCRKICTFEQDRITLKDNKNIASDFSHLYQGIWSYCQMVEYGTFRKWGVKYIYFSKKHITDDEFKEFRKKIIPYDYDSVAVPYKKDYMKIAENLVFATRKDR